MKKLHPAAILLLGVTAGFSFGTAPCRAALPTGFADQLVIDSLNLPAGFTFLPDGRLLIVEQKARIVLVAIPGTGARDTCVFIPDVNTVGGEQGLLGVAVDPAWPSRPYVYLYFDQAGTQKCVLAMFTASGDLVNPGSTLLTLGSRFNILTDIPDASGNHNGGTLRFGPDGKLYVSLGEDADPCGAQDSTTFKGEILRLDVSGLPLPGSGPPAKSAITPAGNPFPGGSASAALVWAYGLRNPFRFHIDPANGRLYIGDVGAGRFEEVDECTGGENFGWPVYEGPELEVQRCGPLRHYTSPIAFYDRTAYANAAIIGATLYRPNPGGIYNFPAEYHGDYFYGEFFVGFLRRLTKSSGAWQAAPPVPGQPNGTDWATGIENVSDWAVGPDGGLYYCKQFPNAMIRRIVYTGNHTGVGESPGTPRLLAAPNPFRPGRGLLRLTLRAETAGPVVFQVFDVRGRRVAAIPGQPGETGEWTAAWNGRTSGGKAAAPGTYFVTAPEGKRDVTTRVVIVP